MRTPPAVVALIGLAVCLSLVIPIAAVGAQQTVTLTVTVETPEGQPVPNAELTATWDGGSSTATTVSNGKAFIDVEAGADVEIAVDHPDYIRNQVFTVEDAQEESVTITVHPRASARVRVVDADGPVARAVVTFRKAGTLVTRETTDANGVVEVGPVEAGDYEIKVRKSRYLTKAVRVELDGETTREIRINQGSVPLTVNVTDPYYSPPRPISDVRVEVAGVGSVRTQPNGIQQIGVPVNVRLEVRLTKPGYGVIEETINVGESPVRLRVHLSRRPSLSVEAFSERVVVGERVLVEVTNEYGDPVADATLLVDGEAVVTTDDDGQAAFDITSAGPHEVVATRGDLASDPVTIRGVEPGGTETTTGGGERTESPGMPGFGVIAAIAGFLGGSLLRRKRKAG